MSSYEPPLNAGIATDAFKAMRYPSPKILSSDVHYSGLKIKGTWTYVYYGEMKQKLGELIQMINGPVIFSELFVRRQRKE